MPLELLARKDCLRVLLALRKAPLRFTEIEDLLELNPAQVDRALKFLRRENWILPRTARAGGRRAAAYALGRRAAAFLAPFRAFAAALRRSRSALGGSTALEELSPRPSAAPGSKLRERLRRELAARETRRSPSQRLAEADDLRFAAWHVFRAGLRACGYTRSEISRLWEGARSPR